MSTSTSSPSMTSKRSSLLINRDFALLWFGQSISVIGDFFFVTALILWVTEQLARGQSWLTLAVSAVAISSAVPTLLFGPFAGVFVDRWDKRRTMLWMDTLRALIVVCFLLLEIVVSGFMRQQGAEFYLLASIYAVNVSMSICSRFFGPARMALIGDIVPVEERPRAISLLSLSMNIGLLLGESLAAPLYVVGGVRWALLFDAFSFLVSFAAIFLLHAPESARSLKSTEQPHFWRELGAGFRISVVNKVLLVVLVTGIFVSLGTGAFNALYLLFGIRNLHTPTTLLGLYGAIYGMGVCRLLHGWLGV